MNKTLIYLLLCIFLIGSVSAYPSIINRVGTRDSPYNDLIKQVPKELLNNLNVIEIVKEYYVCGEFKATYYEGTGHIVFSKIILSNEAGCISTVYDGKDYNFWLYHELGHYVYLRDYKRLSSENWADEFAWSNI